MEPFPITDVARAPALVADRSAAAALARAVGALAGLWRYGAAVLIVAVGSLAAEAVYEVSRVTHLSMVFLSAVLVAAVTLGTGPGLFAAVLAFLVYNFFLVEPRFTINFASAEDFLVALGFLAVALLTGALAGRARDQREKAQARAQSLSLLFDATRVMSATEGEPALRERLADMLRRACEGPVLIGPVETLAQDAEGGPFDPTALARLTARLADQPDGAAALADGPWRLQALVSDSQSLGAAALWRAPDLGRRSAEVEATVGALIDVAAGAIARARLEQAKAQADAVARTERLRTALLSSISHDFRTPLAAILASATGLLEYDAQFDAGARRDLAANIQEEAERLNGFVANLLNMTKLESGVLDIHAIPVSALEIAQNAAARIDRRRGARRIVCVGADGDPQVRADPLLLEQAVANIVENAVVFAPDGSEITLRVSEAAGRVSLEVADEGPGVSAEDLPRLFDKFYRAASTRASAQGTGLGMSIAKGMVEAMGGTVAAAARPDGRSGLSVVIAFPRAA